MEIPSEKSKEFVSSGGDVVDMLGPVHGVTDFNCTTILAPVMMEFEFPERSTYQSTYI